MECLFWVLIYKFDIVFAISFYLVIRWLLTLKKILQITDYNQQGRGWVTWSNHRQHCSSASIVKTQLLKSQYQNQSLMTSYKKRFPCFIVIYFVFSRHLKTDALVVRNGGSVCITWWNNRCLLTYWLVADVKASEPKLVFLFSQQYQIDFLSSVLNEIVASLNTN